VELSEYLFEILREDDEFVLCRGEHSNQSGSPSVLLLAPASMQPALATLKKIEHEYSLKDELDSAWAVRSLALSEQRVLEDPGGETLDRFLSGADGDDSVLTLRRRSRNGTGRVAQKGADSQGCQAGQCSSESRDLLLPHCPGKESKPLPVRITDSLSPRPLETIAG
jgi:hypothetical protein